MLPNGAFNPANPEIGVPGFSRPMALDPAVLIVWWQVIELL